VDPTNSSSSSSPSSWDNEHKPFRLPIGMELLLGDVGVGSSTPAMVRNILNWKDKDPVVANSAWNELNQCNLEVERAFDSLNKLSREPNAFLAAIHACANLLPDHWADQGGEIGTILFDLRNKFVHGVRKGFRKIGELAGVPLEPPGQTRLADATTNTIGCLFAGVPGAGGYDAIFAIVLSPTAVKRVEELWEGWQETRVLPLILREESRGLSMDPIPEEILNYKS